MKSVKEILDQSIGYLEKRKMEAPRRLAERMLMHLLQMDRMSLYLSFERPLEPKELDGARSYLERLGKGEPPLYIEGRTQFFGVELEINRDVLIPRPETEILCDLIVEKLKHEPLAGKVLVDLCSGSGCIGLSLKARFPELKVILVDLSSSALEVAKRNAKRLQLDVSFLQGDLFAPLKGEMVDYLVSNPPYVSDSEYVALDPSIRLFEPEVALRGGPDGLNFYRRIAKEAKAKRLFLEIGASQGTFVKELFEAAGWGSVEVKKDWAGHDRFLFVENE